MAFTVVKKPSALVWISILYPYKGAFPPSSLKLSLRNSRQRRQK